MRHCATSRKVAGSIPDGVLETPRGLNPSGLAMALGSTVSNRNEYQGSPLGGKGGQCVRLTNLPLSRAVYLKILRVSTSRPLGAYLHLCLALHLSFAIEVGDTTFCLLLVRPASVRGTLLYTFSFNRTQSTDCYSKKNSLFK